MGEVGLESQTREWAGDDGLPVDIPAIDERWVDVHVSFPLYFSSFQVSAVSLEAWKGTVTELSESLDWLLRLPYHRFWSQASLDAELGLGLWEAVDSFLRNSPRVTEPELYSWQKSSGTLELQSEVFERVFALLVRVSSFRVERTEQRPEDFLGEAFHAGLVAQLLPVTRLCDVAAVYAPTVQPARKMLSSVLAKRKEYAAELRAMLELTSELLERCVASVRLWKTEGVGSGGSEVVQRSKLVGAVAYSVDALHSLGAFVSAAPAHLAPALLPHKTPLGQTSLFRVVAFVEEMVDLGSEALPSVLGGSKAVWHNLPSVTGRLRWVLASCQDLVRRCLLERCLRPVDDPKAAAKKKSEAGALFTEALGHLLANFPRVGLEYVLAHPVEEDADKLEKVLGGGKAEVDALLKRAEEAKVSGGLRAMEELRSKRLLAAAEESRLTPEQLSTVHSLKDMFSNLSSEFLALVGHQYRWAYEPMLDALLTNSLPALFQHFRLVADRSAEQLAALHSQSMSMRPGPKPLASLVPDEPKPSKPPAAAPPPMAVERAEEPSAKSLRDAAEGLRRLDVGKKRGGALWTDADRSEVTALKGFYETRAAETAADWEEVGEGGEGGLYDDDYDDTYDGVDRGGPAPPRETELDPRHSAIPYALRPDPEDEDDEDDHRLVGIPANRNRNYAAKPPPEKRRPGPPHGGPPRQGQGQGQGQGAPQGQAPAQDKAKTSYTGGTQRLRKEQHSAHNKANRARAKYSKGMF